MLPRIHSWFYKRWYLTKSSVLWCLLLRQIDFITQAQSHSLKRPRKLIICKGKTVVQSIKNWH